MQSANKTYFRSFTLSMLAYVILLPLTIIGLGFAAGSPWRFLLALLPVIPIGYALWSFIRFLAALDELQQRIQLTAIAFAAGAVGLLTFTYGFLEVAGFPPLPAVWVFPALIILWGLGLVVAGRRYQ